MTAADRVRDLRRVPDWVVAELAERRPVAIRHPLGFVCLPLARDELNVCVHLWTTQLRPATPTTSQIHCHNWDLTSHVLYGHVRNDLVVIEDDDVAPTHRVFEVRPDDGHDTITPTDRLVRWRRAATASHRAGDTYELPAGSFHMTAVPAGQEAATVVQARLRPGLVDQSLGLPHLPGHTVSRQRYDPDESALAVGTVLRRLATSIAPSSTPHDNTRGATP
jgi:hypothetical protein